MSSKNDIDGDTPPHLSPEVIARARAMSLEERALRTFELCQATRELMLEGIKLRHVGISDLQARVKLKELMYDHYSRLKITKAY